MMLKKSLLCLTLGFVAYVSAMDDSANELSFIPVVSQHTTPEQQEYSYASPVQEAQANVDQPLQDQRHEEDVFSDEEGDFIGLHNQDDIDDNEQLSSYVNSRRQSKKNSPVQATTSEEQDSQEDEEAEEGEEDDTTENLFQREDSPYIMVKIPIDKSKVLKSKSQYAQVDLGDNSDEDTVDNDNNDDNQMQGAANNQESQQSFQFAIVNDTAFIVYLYPGNNHENQLELDPKSEASEQFNESHIHVVVSNGTKILWENTVSLSPVGVNTLQFYMNEQAELAYTYVVN